MYNGSIKELVVSETPFVLEPEVVRHTLSDGSRETEDSFFARKLEAIKKMADERTLIIIDNFDVEYDEQLAGLLDGQYRVLVTTRCDYSRLYPTVKVETIASVESLIEIFMQNYDGFDVEDDDPALITLIELVNRHTYTIELLAQHMGNSGQTAEEMVNALQKEGISSLSEEITEMGNQTYVAYENLLKMFSVFSLSETEKSFLQSMSMMPLDGVDVKELRFFAGLDSNKVIKDLEKRSWLTRNVNGIALHPIIRDVVRHELPVTAENSKEFINRFAETITPMKTWHASFGEREYHAAIAYEVLKAFPEISEELLELYINIENLLSFSVKPDMAAALAKRLYEYFREHRGENAYETGWWAFKLGWVYSFNQHTEGSMKKAKEWLELSYSILSEIELEKPEQKAVYGQLLGELSRVHLFLARADGGKDFDDAVRYAEITIQKNSEWFKPGEKFYVRVANGCLKLADVYIAKGDFEEADELADKAYEILSGMYGDDDSDTIYALSRKAYALFGLKKNSEALEMAVKTIKGYDKFFSDINYSKFEMLVCVVKCCLELGSTEEAEKYLERAEKIAGKLLGEDAVQRRELQQLREMLNG